jgi:hypothetical protein
MMETTRNPRSSARLRLASIWLARPRRLRRARRSLRLAVLAIVLSSVFVATEAQARRTRREVPRGPVSGLEMGIEGSMKVPPGGRLRWFVTVYEIVRGRDLRPAAATKLKALASFHRKAPVATATTDRYGRARIEFEVPAKLEQPFRLVVEARSPKRVMRRFDVRVQLAPRYRTELFVDRSRLALGAPLRAWGRVFDLSRNRPSPRHALRLSAKRGGALIGREHRLKTDARGVFQASLSAPARAGAFQVEVLADHAETVRRSLQAARVVIPELVVVARPAKRVVRPGTTIDVDVVVRRPDGRPVPRATLTGLSIPLPKNKDDSIKPVQTDTQGRARVPWRVPRRAGPSSLRWTGAIADVTGTVRALREGIGTGQARVVLRVARQALHVSWSAEGGRLVPGLPSRLFVKVQRADGTPAAGLAIRLRGGRVQAAPVVTDRAGVAVIDATVLEKDTTAPTSCRGPTVAAASLRAGTLTKRLCLPVDPDSTLRVRSAPTTRAGGKLQVRLLARAAVARYPVAVTILARTQYWQWRPIDRKTIGAPQKSISVGRKVTLEVPKDATGPIWIRARPLVGAERQEVRGGTALVWSVTGPDRRLRVRPAASGAMRVERPGALTTSLGFVLALPPARGQALLAELRSARGHGASSLGADILDGAATGADARAWMGFVAARTPADTAVSAVLRGGSRVTLAMPDDAVGAGLLRDPWRSRARFVRGRIGRVLLAVEKRVTDSIPKKLSDVAVRTRRGWRFNSEILTAVGVQLGSQAITGLDGSPLSIASLRALDKNLTFDNVARRLTRQRQLRLLVALAGFVRAKQLDYGWPRRKKPTSWLAALRGWRSPDGQTRIRKQDLFDAWGRPFKLVKARGARARFRFLEPVPGYELLSAGPDGRFGNADDRYDPFARVLPKGSIYGEAVGEEALVARLRGVTLGRATLAMLAQAFSVGTPRWNTSDSAASAGQWDSLAPVADTRHALELQEVCGAFPAVSRFAPIGARATLELPLSRQPRRYVVVAGAYDADGRAAFDARPLSAGAPVLIEAVMPQRLRPNEPLRVPVRLLGTGPSRQVSVRATGSGAIRFAIKGPRQFSLNSGRSRTLQLTIEATRAGSGRVRLQVLADGKLLRRFDRELLATPDGSLRAQHVGALVDGGPLRAKLALPRDARPIRSYLVVSAPRDLLRDPGFDGLRRSHPELLAWAHTIRGEPMPRSLAVELRRRGGRVSSQLEAACAAVAWSAVTPAAKTGSAASPTKLTSKSASHPQLKRALARFVRAVRGGVKSMRQRAALLVALSSSANLSRLADPRSHATQAPDPIAELVRELRKDGWFAIKTERSRPAVMARLAAGLLLANRRDVPGRALFDEARKALVKSKRGGKVLLGETGRAVDGWIGTAALAIAARQLGQDTLAKELARGLAPRLYVAHGNAEAGFWLLAASVYGALGAHGSTSRLEGAAGPGTIEVELDGARRQLALKRGSVTLALSRRRLGLVVRSKRPVFATPRGALRAAGAHDRQGGHRGDDTGACRQCRRRCSPRDRRRQQLTEIDGPPRRRGHAPRPRRPFQGRGRLDPPRKGCQMDRARRRSGPAADPSAPDRL